MLRVPGISRTQALAIFESRPYRAWDELLTLPEVEAAVVVWLQAAGAVLGPVVESAAANELAAPLRPGGSDPRQASK